MVENRTGRTEPVGERLDDVEKLFYKLAFKDGRMLTAAGPMKERQAAAVAIAARFMRERYNGIQTSYDGDVVVFYPGAIKGITFGL